MISLVIFTSKDNNETTVSAIPLSDVSFTTINPSKMEEKGSESYDQKTTSDEVTDAFGTTYMPVFTYASETKKTNR